MASRTQLYLIAGIGMIVNLSFIGPLALRSAAKGWGDYPGLYLRSQLVFSGHLYDTEIQSSRQEEVFSQTVPSIMPMRLPFYYVLLWPLAKLPYPAAHHVWVLLLAIAAACALYLFSLSLYGNGVLIAGAVSLPLLVGVSGGQDAAICLLILSIGLRLRPSYPFVSGMVLSLLLIKFHLFIYIPGLFLLRREFRTAFGIGTGILSLLALSTVVAGPHWVREYLAIVTNPMTNPGGQIMPNVHGATTLMHLPSSVEITICALVAVAAITAQRAISFELALAVSLIAGILTSFHCYVSDCVLLIPGLTLVTRFPSELVRTLAVFCLSPLPYMAAQLGFGIVPATLLVVLIGLVVISNYSSPARQIRHPPKVVLTD